jgi:hypothetical protein
MSLSDAVAAVRSRAESLWPALEPLVPLAWPNENQDGSGNPLPARNTDGTSAPWVMIELRWNGGEFVSIGAPGSNLARREGHIWCFAFIPEGSGESRAHELASKAAHLFEGQDFGGLVCQAMMPGGPADSEDGSYYGQTASVPFTFDETA